MGFLVALFYVYCGMLCVGLFKAKEPRKPFIH
jgi:hypothetical protein